MKNLNIVILAAGQGSRMATKLPKVLNLMAEKPLVRHVFESAKKLNPNKIILVVGKGKKQVADHFKNEEKVVFASQQVQLGTGDAVKKALPFLDTENTLVLLGDVPLISSKSLRVLINTKKNSNIKVLTSFIENPFGYGRIIRENGKIKCIKEDIDCDINEKKIKEVNTGIIYFQTEKLKSWINKIKSDNKQSEFYLTDVLKIAYENGAIISSCNLNNPDEMLGVNTLRQLLDVERKYYIKTAFNLIDKGLNIKDPNRFDLRGKLNFKEGCSIDINCILEGNISLGRNVTIGANCILKDVKIGDESKILPFSMIEGSQFKEDCSVGPYARIRPGTDIKSHSKVGNFVEIKSSQIDKNSKVNHLSYIGDATVGSNVNIGAGTITCNYDGEKKHRTKIEDDVFVGSNSQLVAPVTIKKGATIGAGSTITKTAAENKLTLSRCKQVTLKKWKNSKRAK